MLKEFRDLIPGKLYATPNRLGVVTLADHPDDEVFRSFPADTLFMFVGLFPYQDTEVDHPQVLVRNKLYWLVYARSAQDARQVC